MGHYEAPCVPCAGQYDGPDHNHCAGRCGCQYGAGNDCREPCPCGCDKPLDRNEVARLRKMLEAAR